MFQPSFAQTAELQSAAPLAATAATTVPALVPFAGTLTEAGGKPVASETAISFLVFKDQTGGEPLFAETQDVIPDSNGHYKIQLGATLANGLPADLFASGEARWLEVQAAGQAPQPRVLIASVPYAIKAADAATLGGLPASAFVLAGTKAAGELANAVANASTTGSTVTTTGGTAGYVPQFIGASTIADSPVFVSGTNIGIGTTTPSTTLDVKGTALITGALTANGGATVGGTLLLPATGTASTTSGFSSQLTKIYTSAYNAASRAVVQPRFEWEGEVTGNNTASPSATLNLLSSTTSAAATETGFHFNSNGTIRFAPGQTFPGTGTGNGTITGVTAGTGLTGGGIADNVTLAVNQNVVAFQSDLANAENALNASIASAQTAAVSTSESYANSAFLPAAGGTVNGSLTVNYSNLSTSPNGGNYFTVQGGNGDYVTGSPGLGISLSAGYGGTATLNNAPQGVGGNGGSVSIASGNGGNTMFDGPPGNAGSIYLNLGAPGAYTYSTYGNPYGNRGHVIVQGDDNGYERGTPAQLIVQGSSVPTKQLLLGYVADGNAGNYGYGAIQATNDGYVNTPLALNPNGGGVGIQTTTVTNSLTIGQGQGAAIADGWQVYSSRRFKTDIQTLPNALDKVEKLRGVSYTLKATGKHEIGVIAEEVGNVVPEVVTYEENGKDARSVDYTRLTALLIEAVKQQQTEIVKQQAQIADALREVKVQRIQLRSQAASIVSLKARAHAAGEAHQLDRELASGKSNSAQPVLVAAK
jgi:hypothetical protein